MNRTRRALRLTLAFAVLLAVPAAMARAQDAGASGRAAAAAPPPLPRLVVIVVIDQCRADYLQRFAHVMSPDGIERLLAMGASWPNAAYTHTVTSTAPGHAAIATGCRPARAGIPENEWLDRDGRTVYCVSDPASHLVGSVPGLPDAGMSAAHLERQTLGDVLQAELGQDCLVLSLAWKDRAALLLGGRHSDGTYWIEERTGSWVGSSALVTALPDWLTALNAAGPVRSRAGRVWERSSSAEDAQGLAGRDDAPGEQLIPGFGTTFPHAIPAAPPAGASCAALANLVHISPLGDEITMDAVRAALQDTALGRDDKPDLLCIGFSSLDGAGHAFGPDSQEVMDVFLAVDRRIAELLGLLDHVVGPGRWTLALSSDHGVTPLSERTGVPRLDLAALQRSVEDDLSKAFGAPPLAGGHDRASWVLGLSRPSLWLDVPRLKAAGIKVADAASRASAALARFPGVLLAATRAELAAALAAPQGKDADLLALAHDVHATRSGDVLFLLKPGVMPRGEEAADHGSQSPDDRRVPLILAGDGIAPGVHEDAASPMDIAPTLAALLGLRGLQGADGRVLAEAAAALSADAAPATPGR